MQPQYCTLATTSGSLTARLLCHVDELLDLTLNIFLDLSLLSLWTAEHTTTFLRQLCIFSLHWLLYIGETVVLEVFLCKDLNHLLIPIQWLGALPCPISGLYYWLNVMFGRNSLSCFNSIVNIVYHAIHISPPNGLARSGPLLRTSCKLVLTIVLQLWLRVAMCKVWQSWMWGVYPGLCRTWWTKLILSNFAQMFLIHCDHGMKNEDCHDYREGEHNVIASGHLVHRTVF